MGDNNYKLENGSSVSLEDIFNDLNRRNINFDDIKFLNESEKRRCLYDFIEYLKNNIKDVIFRYPNEKMYNIDYDYNKEEEILNMWSITRIRNFDDLWDEEDINLKRNYSNEIENFIDEYFNMRDKEEIYKYWYDKAYNLLDEINQKFKLPEFYTFKVSQGSNGEKYIEREVNVDKVKEDMNWVYSYNFGGVDPSDIHYVFGSIYFYPNDNKLYNLINSNGQIQGRSSLGRFWTLEEVSVEEAKRIFKEYGGNYNESLSKKLDII